MPVELVNPDPRYGRVLLAEPAPTGYLHLAADAGAAHRAGPVLHRSGSKRQLLGALKSQARQLARHDAVERVTVYDAVAFAPPGGAKSDAAVPAWFDVVVLAEVASPDAVSAVRATQDWQALATTAREQARRVHQIAARNVRRVAEVDKTRPGLFLFNYFSGADPALAVDLWDYLAGWYEVETGLDNSTLLAPLEGESSDYVLINHARWDASLPQFVLRQLPKKSFRSYMLANLKAHRVTAMPVLYRLA
jgi:hypothetical protein